MAQARGRRRRRAARRASTCVAFATACATPAPASMPSKTNAVKALRGDRFGALGRARRAADVPAFAAQAAAPSAARCSRARSRTAGSWSWRGVPLGAHVAVALAREMPVAHALADARRREAGAWPTPPWRAPAGRHRRAAPRRAAARPASPELPAAISTLRRKRSRPVRLTGVPAKRARKARVVELQQLGERRVVGLGARVQSVLRARRRRTCSTGTRRGSRRSRTRGCPWRGGTRPGCAPCARSTGRRGSGAHRADRAPGTPPSGTRRGSAGSCRSGRPRARRAELGGREDGAEEQPRAVLARHQHWCACPASRCPAAAASGFSITGAVSTNTFTSAPLSRGEARGELLQLALEDVVVVLALRIDGDGAARRVVERLERICLAARSSCRA